MGRDDGREKGEMAAIFFDETRFEALADGHFWLSETPDLPGSIGWDAALPRVASWVLLADREAEGRRLFVFNAHFDHQGVRARLESARLVREQIDALDPRVPVLVLGDFNAQAGGRVHRALTSAGDVRRPLVDAHEGGGGTLSGFGTPPPSWEGLRIDWILASEELVPLEADIDRARYRGRYPSDHYPVRVVFAYREDPEEKP